MDGVAPMSASLDLDMPTLFVARGFVQIVLAAAMAATTIRPGGGRPQAVWIVGDCANCLAWVLLPLGLYQGSVLLSAVQAMCAVVAVILHAQALLLLFGRRVWWEVTILVPACVLLGVLSAGVNPSEGGAFMAAAVAVVLTPIVITGMITFRPLMRSGTYITMVLGGLFALGAALLRGGFGLFAPDILGDPSATGTLTLLAFAGSFIGLVLVHMAWLSLLKDRAEQELERLAFTDSLTGLGNRRALENLWAGTLRSHRHSESPISVVMIDLDKFKLTNDRWGHDVGDRALVLVADLLRSEIAATDLAIRMGGEEFCLVLPGTGSTGAREVVDRLRGMLWNRPCLPDGTALSFSAGITEVCEADTGLVQVVARADRALYAAKRNGRARSETALAA